MSPRPLPLERRLLKLLNKRAARRELPADPYDALDEVKKLWDATLQKLERRIARGGGA